jgi:hypothetical protein
MQQNYCFKCGCYTAIDGVTKLCAKCYAHWMGTSGSPARTKP